MKRRCSMFSQIVRWFPRGEFASVVREHKGERHPRGFTCWQQFVAMLYCRFGHAQSLRELCGGLGSVEGKLRHLGIRNGPKATTLSYANAHRPWQLYQGLLYTMLERCRREALLYGKRKFRFKPAVTGCQHGGITLGLPCDTLKAAPLRIANQLH